MNSRFIHALGLADNLRRSPADEPELPAVRDHALATYPIGLLDKPPLERLVILEPAVWGERFFDELQQRLTWTLQDEEGQTLALTLPFTP